MAWNRLSAELTVLYFSLALILLGLSLWKEITLLSSGRLDSDTQQDLTISVSCSGLLALLTTGLLVYMVYQGQQR